MQREAEAVLADACALVEHRADEIGVVRLDSKLMIQSDFHLGGSTTRNLMISIFSGETVLRAVWDTARPDERPFFIHYRGGFYIYTLRSAADALKGAK